MNISTQSSQEPCFKNKSHDEITTFWQLGLFDSFLGANDVIIHYAIFLHETNSADPVNFPAIVVVPGRCESYLKYHELIFDLYHQGYNVFILDHRGQGLSGRLLANPNKGYVTNFQDYVNDFRYFIEQIVIEHASTRPYLLAHSMGGAIALRFMQDSPNAIKAAIIASPMLDFYTGIAPQILMKKLLNANLTLNNAISDSPWYFLGQKDYVPIDFTKNRLTHSKRRYQTTLDLYTDNKTIQLGGVTCHWLMQSIQAQKDIFANIHKLTTPIQVLQAGSDLVVCNKTQDDFCRQLHAIQPQSCPSGSPASIVGAYHELFFERDEYRNSALRQSIAWFKKFM